MSYHLKQRTVAEEDTFLKDAVSEDKGLNMSEAMLTTTNTCNYSVQNTELKIPVPWGHVAAKVWGDPGDTPILCVHGMQDNANTFDHLIPLLPSNFYYVCIDLPGHGLSSHFPAGFILDFMDYVIVLKRIVDYFKWRTYYYMGHSLGGQLGSYFAALYPQNIVKLIMLDTIASFCVPTEQFLDRHKKVTNKLLTLEARMTQKSAPRYSFPEAVDRMMRSRISKLTHESAVTLIKRSLVEHEDGYSYSTDQRLKFALWPLLDIKQHMSVLREIRCPQLIVSARESRPMLKMTIFKDVLALFKRRSNFKYFTIEGNHDVHMNHPERVSPIVTKFLLVQKSRL